MSCVPRSQGVTFKGHPQGPSNQKLLSAILNLLKPTKFNQNQTQKNCVHWCSVISTFTWPTLKEDWKKLEGNKIASLRFS